LRLVEIVSKDVVHAMGVMGLSKDQQTSVFRVLSAILTLGNISFSQNDKDEARVDNQDELGWVAYLLQVCFLFCCLIAHHRSGG
jgi:myosin-1